MTLNIGQALEYPYRHWKPCILVPGLLYLGVMLVSGVISVLLYLIGLLVVLACFGPDAVGEVLQESRGWATSLPGLPHTVMAMASPQGWLALASSAPAKALMAALEILGDLLGAGVGMVFSAYMLGLQWQLLDRWQRDGFDAPPPPLGHGLQLLADGWKPLLFYTLITTALVFPIGVVVGLVAALTLPRMGEQAPWVLLSILVPLSVITMVVALALSPYYWAPMVHSAATRRMGDLFRFSRAIQAVRGRYWQIMLAYLWSIPISLAYTLGGVMVGLLTCCVGFLAWPFLLMGALAVSQYHLIGQAFLGQQADG